MKKRTRELAKVGIFGSVENPVIVTERDLEEIAETFAEQNTAPVQFGHWADAASPRLGNVVSVSYNPATKTLTGTVEEHDELAKAVDEGYFPDCSIGAKKRASDGRMYLHHLAYLGEEPPAVKDLKNSINTQLANAGNKEVAAADDGADFIQLPSAAEKQLNLSDPDDTENKSKKETVMTEKEIEAMQEENARLKAENEAKTKLLSDQYRNRAEQEKQRLKDAVSGKLPEADAERLLNLCDAFDETKTIELADADGTKRTESPISVLADVFSRVPLPVEPGALNLSDPLPKGENPKPNYASMMNAM